MAIEFVKFWKERSQDIPVAIVINTGNVVVGNIGSGKMMNHTVVGDNYSLTESVLQKVISNDFPEVVITQSTKDLIGNQIPLKEIYSIQFSGKEINLYEVLKTK